LLEDRDASPNRAGLFAHASRYEIGAKKWRGGRRGRRQVSTALMSRATHTLQWIGQRVASAQA